MRWLQDITQSIVDNLNKVRREASRYFGNKNKEHLKAKIDELKTSNKIETIRDLYNGITFLKKGYQLRHNIIKDEKSGLFVDSHTVLARWRNHFSQQLNVHWDNDVRHAEIQEMPKNVYT